MMNGAETDKRKWSRADVRFIVTYGRKVEDAITDQDISQTKNISEGGMALTTRKPFSPHTSLALKINVPIAGHPVETIGTVIESKEITRNFIYLTRISFSGMDYQMRQAIQQTVAHYLRKNRPQN